MTPPGPTRGGGAGRPASSLVQEHLPPLLKCLRLAGPLALSFLATIGLGATDILMMGWLDAEKLAAGALAGHYAILLHTTAAGILSGGVPLMAQAYGARRPRDVRTYFWSGIWSSWGSRS